MSEKLENRLKMSEGFRSKLYRDTSSKTGFEGKPGKVSIGYGYNIDDKGLPLDIIEELFQRTVQDAREEALMAFPWLLELDEARREVVIEMVFNQGLKSVMAFTATLGALQRKAYKESAGHLRDSLVYRQLPKRYEGLAKIIETGEY